MTGWPEIRGLDHIYIRVKTDTGWESRCLTDCPWETVKQWLETKAGVATSEHYFKEVIEHLHMRLRWIGDSCDIVEKELPG